MMHILECLLQREGYTYLRMDGTTAMSQRQQTIHTFNNVCVKPVERLISM